MSEQHVYYCPRCQFGRCRPGKATYVHVHRGMLISVPDTPAYICDACGYREFDQGAVQQLRALVGGQKGGGADDTTTTYKTSPFDKPDANKPQQPKP